MKCTCPKCHANIELDLPEVTEEGTSAACPACNARFNVFRESFGGRALRKSHEISCASCGNELGPQTYCTSCGAQFPDYLLVSSGRKMGRKPGKKVVLKSSPFPKREKAVNDLPSLDMAMRQEPSRASKLLVKSKRPQTIALSVVVIIALAAGGASYYLKKRAENQYVRSFALAAYCIATGEDKSLKAGQRISNDWKAKIASGQTFKAGPNADEDRELNNVRTKLDEFKVKLSVEPKKFSNNNERITKLEGSFNKLRTLVYAPGDSLPNFIDATNKMDDEYKQSIKEFKAGMPDDLMEGLLTASKKYRGLRPLLK
jgi:hypothetical protein